MKKNKEIQTNGELANAYLVIQGIAESYLTMVKRIKTCEIDLVKHFATHGNFNELSLPGIGKKTKAVLVDILSGREKKEKKPTDVRMGITVHSNQPLRRN